MPLFRTVDRLRDLRETILDAAPTASATAPLFQLGLPLIGGNALGTVLGGRQANGYLGDYINWQGTDAGGVQRNRLSMGPTGTLTVGDSDCANSQIILKGNNSGNNVVLFGTTGGGVPQMILYDAGGGSTKTIGRTDISAVVHASLVSAGPPWLFQANGFRFRDASTSTDRFRIGSDGKISTNQAATATGPVGTVVKKIPVYDAVDGTTLLGYVPVYSTIT